MFHIGHLAIFFFVLSILCHRLGCSVFYPFYQSLTIFLKATCLKGECAIISYLNKGGQWVGHENSYPTPIAFSFK